MRRWVFTELSGDWTLFWEPHGGLLEAVGARFAGVIVLFAVDVLSVRRARMEQRTETDIHRRRATFETSEGRLSNGFRFIPPP